MPTSDLLAFLFDARPHPLSPLVGQWLAQSKRFAAFAETHHTKIRKKLRETTDSEAIRDLACELEAAYLLSLDRRLTVEYEKCAGGARCPDFLVTYTTSYAFHVEVTRVRSANNSPSSVEGVPPRLTTHIADKLRQLQPSMLNLLWMVLDDATVSIDLPLTMAHLRALAERQDPTIIGRHHLPDASAFFKHYPRLSGIVLRVASDHHTSRRETLWLNPHARYTLPAPLKTVLQSLA